MVHEGTGAIPNRHGAEAARGAHNPEDTGSKPVVGILFYFAQTHFPVSHSFPRIPLISRYRCTPPPHFFSSTIYSGLFNACLPACLRMPITLCALPPCSPRFHRPIFPPRPLYMRKTPSTSARCAEMTRWCSG